MKRLLDREGIGEKASREVGERIVKRRWAAVLDDLGQDLRYGIRQTVRCPAFSFVIVFTLAMGIGANVAIFTVLRGVVLRALPWPEAQSVVAIWETVPYERWHMPFTTPDYFEVCGQNSTFEDIGAYSLSWFNVGGVGEPSRIRGALATASAMRVLGVQPAMGRLFTDEDEREGGNHVALLSDGVWKRLFGADPSLLGRDITINGESTQVVGIMPERFEFPRPWSIDGGRSELWVPLTLSRDDSRRTDHWLPAIGRLKDGVTIEEAEAELGTIAARLAEEYPATNAQTLMWIEPQLFRNLPSTRRTLLLLLGAVGLVLLIACANVASMLLARGAARMTEVAVRASLGASGGRLKRQLLTESLLLSLMGGLAGVAVAFCGVGAIRGLLPPDIPRVEGIAVESGVLVFALALTLLTGLIFGLAPAFYAARYNLAAALKLGRSGLYSGRSRSRALAALVVAQLTLALVLVNTSVLLLVSHLNVLNIPKGFYTDDVLVAEIAVEGPAYEEPDTRVAFWNRLLERVRAQPGVGASGVTTKIPLEGGHNYSVLVEGETYDPEAERPLVELSYVTPGYLEAMGIDLQRGRRPQAGDLQLTLPGDGSAMRRNILVNRAFVERYYADKDPIGRIVRDNNDPPTWEGPIVGVVEDVRQWELTRPPIPEIYFPFSANPRNDSNLIVRVDGPAHELDASLREVLRELDPQLTFSRIRTMGEVVEEANQGRRFYTLLITLFTVTALVLALVGIYGVTSFNVSQRIHEVGVRMALGANKSNVFGLFVRRGLILASVGTMIGLTATLWVDRLIGYMLYGLSPLHPLVLVGGALFISAVTVAATAMPALRATRIELVHALRTE